ncbi:hypothetical protein PTSG_11190 [Salpingoeca rosetta]|uniref:OCIA domain-containing protein n=1 Tax=Salpingoeca rosetta (strain ATCC 50818 / BSB-021) TaxID=946362 RepID=F2USP2_SALR5|nr:uncharacterized protein PTSG_11190 [Salpingoeca rosetta]EGD81151.1 hypothetical protein PTSG_11190 [Salpingoeca rosetta]|eukprot:XP_004987836.1 hypothetical protein PTSG_11190 [Salpingoeca rosetta]
MAEPVPSSLGAGVCPNARGAACAARMQREQASFAVHYGAAAGLGFARWVVSRRGRPPTRLVSIAYHVGFGSAGFYAGVVSYQPRCVEKILALSNSPMADELRAFMERAKHAKPPPAQQQGQHDTRPLQYQQQQYQQQHYQEQQQEYQQEPAFGDARRYPRSRTTAPAQPPDEVLTDDTQGQQSPPPAPGYGGHGYGYGYGQGSMGAGDYGTQYQRPVDRSAEPVRDHVPETFAPDGLPTYDDGSQDARRDTTRGGGFGSAADEWGGRDDEDPYAAREAGTTPAHSYADLRSAHRQTHQPPSRQRPAWARQSTDNTAPPPASSSSASQYNDQRVHGWDDGTPQDSRAVRTRVSRYGDELEDDNFSSR